MQLAATGLVGILAALAGKPATAQYGSRYISTDVPKVQFFTPAPNETPAPVVMPQAPIPQADSPRAAPASEPTSPLTAPSIPIPGPASATPTASPAAPRPQPVRPPLPSRSAASPSPSGAPSGAAYFVPGQRTASAAIATVTDPSPQAEAFYRTYLQIRTPGVLNAAQRARLRPFLAPALDAALAAAEQAEKTYKAKHNGTAPPLVEGDLFSSLFEGATAFIVQECTDHRPPGTAPPGMQCHLQLTHTNPTTNQKIEWRDTLLLIRLGNTWRISDMIYGGKFVFGQTGQLTDLLQIVIKEAKETKE